MHVAARQAARSVTRSGARSSRWARGSLPLPRHAPARGNTHRQAAPSSASSSTAATVARRTQRIQEPAERPSTVQLRNVFIAAGLPMVGFGMMDNIVMVSAGDLIDNSIGLRFGLSTLAAAACGQVVSDVCGTVFGGWVELMAARLGLPIPDLTPRQRAMRIVRGTATAGAVLGVILGCTLGMTTLLFIDTTSKEREKKQREMDSLFKTIMDHSHEMLGAERCSLFLVDRRKGELWSKVATDNQGMLQVRDDEVNHSPPGQGCRRGSGADGHGGQRRRRLQGQPLLQRRRQGAGLPYHQHPSGARGLGHGRSGGGHRDDEQTRRPRIRRRRHQALHHAGAPRLRLPADRRGKQLRCIRRLSGRLARAEPTPRPSPLSLCLPPLLRLPLTWLLSPLRWPFWARRGCYSRGSLAATASADAGADTGPIGCGSVGLLVGAVAALPKDDRERRAKCRAWRAARRPGRGGSNALR
ncbi:unnamed protein product [Phaeothamnion confervicola]